MPFRHRAQMKRPGNYLLAVALTSILALYATGLGTPVLTAVPAFATHDDHNNDDNNNDEGLEFLIDVIQCFTNNDDNNNDDNDFSDDVQDCIQDVIDDYFNNNHDNHDNNDHNNHDDHDDHNGNN